MDSLDLSIVIPGFRPHRWVETYNTISQSCTRYSFEIIFVGPYSPPDELKNNPQIKYIEDWGTPTRCLQIGVANASAALFTLGADDVIFFPDGLNQAMDLYKSVCGEKDIVALRWREGADFSGVYMDDIYYLAKTFYHTLALIKTLPPKHRPNYHFEQLNIPDHYRLAQNPLMSVHYCKEIGGYDCVFEHLAWASHDFSYRVQRDGGKIHLSPAEVLNCSQIYDATHPERVPIETANTNHDGPLLKQMHKDPNIVNRIRIDFDNWKQSPEVWIRRFPNGKNKLSGV